MDYTKPSIIIRFEKISLYNKRRYIKKLKFKKKKK